MGTARRLVTVIGLLTGLLAEVCPASARAQCALPNLLTNGQPTDATQVMANFDALVTCASPAGSAGALQYTTGTGFGGVGPLTDGQLAIGSTGNAPQAATLSAGPGITITNDPGSITISGGLTLENDGSSLGTVTTLNAAPGLTASVTSGTGTLTPAVTATGTIATGNCLKAGTGGTGSVTIADAGTSCGAGGGGRGLYSWSMSAAPTLVSTGLTGYHGGTGSGITTADTPAGLQVSGNLNFWLAKSAPTPPYSVTVLVSSDYALPDLGWSDGTKFQFIYATASTSCRTIVQSNNTYSSYNSTNYGPTTLPNSCNDPIWLKIYDDGTTVHFYTSSDGYSFFQCYSVAKSSGFLGSSGYSNIVIGSFGGTAGTPLAFTVMSWSQGTS